MMPEARHATVTRPDRAITCRLNHTAVGRYVAGMGSDSGNGGDRDDILRQVERLKRTPMQFSCLGMSLCTIGLIAALLLLAWLLLR